MELEVLELIVFMKCIVVLTAARKEATGQLLMGQVRHGMAISFETYLNDRTRLSVLCSERIEFRYMVSSGTAIGGRLSRVTMASLMEGAGSGLFFHVICTTIHLRSLRTKIDRSFFITLLRVCDPVQVSIHQSQQLNHHV